MNESPKRGLLLAFGRLLGPLVRILIRNGVTYSEFTETTKQIFIDVAGKDFAPPRAEHSLIRTAVLTGLTVDEIEEVIAIKNSAKKNGLETNLNHIASVLSAWHTDSDFTGPYGVPLELQIAAEKEELDFRELVKRHIGDVDPQPLLTELQNVGAVVETEKDWFKVLTRFYMPKGNAPAGMDHLSRSVEDFVTTLDHNATEEDPNKKMFERQIYTANGITQNDLVHFREYSKEKAKILLEDLDNWLSQTDEPTEENEKNTVTGIGIYYYLHDNHSTNSRN